jgi:multidrug efflux system membrane fusion protein
MPVPFRRPAVVGLSLALVACAPKDEPIAKVDPPRPVRTMVVQPAAAAQTVQLPGEVRPRVESRLGFRVGGKLASRSVSVGDRVRAGQELARLDPTDLAPALQAQQAQVAAARTERELAAVDLQRLRSLQARNYISQASLDRQQASHDAAASRLEAAEAQLRQARNAIDFQVLRADADGVVTAVEAEAGQVVSPGQPVIRVARGGELEVAIDIPEGGLALARSAREWVVTVPALGGRTLAGRVRELSPVADPASRTYPARIALSGDLAGVALGMTTVVRATRAGEAGFVVPLSALHSKDGTPRVWRVDPARGTVEAVVVETAGLLDDAVRIRAGLSAGDRIVTAGANLLVPNQAVRVLADPAAAAAGAAAPAAASAGAAGALVRPAAAASRPGADGAGR